MAPGVIRAGAAMMGVTRSEMRKRSIHQQSVPYRDSPTYICIGPLLYTRVWLAAEGLAQPRYYILVRHFWEFSRGSRPAAEPRSRPACARVWGSAWPAGPGCTPSAPAPPHPITIYICLLWQMAYINADRPRHTSHYIAANLDKVLYLI